MEKVGFGRVREFPKFENSGSGITGVKKVGFGRELKTRVSGIFRVVLYRAETSNESGTEKVGFGWVREFPKFEKLGSGISGMKKVGFGREFKSRQSGIFGF